jgi:hypothetical protein
LAKDWSAADKPGACRLRPGPDRIGRPHRCSTLDDPPLPSRRISGPRGGSGDETVPRVPPGPWTAGRVVDEEQSALAARRTACRHRLLWQESGPVSSPPRARTAAWLQAARPRGPPKGRTGARPGITRTGLILCPAAVAATSDIRCGGDIDGHGVAPRRLAPRPVRPGPGVRALHDHRHRDAPTPPPPPPDGTDEAELED